MGQQITLRAVTKSELEVQAELHLPHLQLSVRDLSCPAGIDLRAGHPQIHMIENVEGIRTQF
jgi:hypothetical protein